MGENAGADFVQSLGQQPATPELEDTGEETPADSQPEEKTDTEEKPKETPPEGEEEKKKGFHEHPAWKEREEKWEGRLETQRKDFETKIADLESKITTRQEAHDELTEADVPDWFNGDLDTYKKYYSHQTKLMEDKAKAIAEKIVDGKFKESRDATEKETKAVEDATNWFRSEVERIESDKDLNPNGESIDKEALLKIAQEHDCIDSKGRWNYGAAYRIYATTHKPGEQKPKEIDMKTKIAAITSKKDSKADGNQQKTVRTPDYFKKNKPW